MLVADARVDEQIRLSNWRGRKVSYRFSLGVGCPDGAMGLGSEKGLGSDKPARRVGQAKLHKMSKDSDAMIEVPRGFLSLQSRTEHYPAAPSQVPDRAAVASRGGRRRRPGGG